MVLQTVACLHIKQICSVSNIDKSGQPEPKQETFKTQIMYIVIKSIFKVRNTSGMKLY